MFFVQYMQQIRNAPELAEAFCKIHPNEILYLTFLNDIRHKYFQYDKRNADYAVYTPEVVLLVVLWSTLCGNTTCKNVRNMLHSSLTTILYYSLLFQECHHQSS